MLKYFALLVDLLELDVDLEQYKSFAKFVEENLEDYDFFFYHRHSFLFEGYIKLLKGEMELDEFLRLGDITDTYTIDNMKRKDSYSFLVSGDILKYNTSTCILVDDISLSLAGEIKENKNVKLFSL